MADGSERLMKCKEILRDLYDSEELKIDSNRCRAIAKTIEMLCTDENTEFNVVFTEVTEEVEQRKKEPATIRNKFQSLYMYQVERLPVLLKKLGKEQNGSINDPILWQMIVERLFMERSINVQAQLEIPHEFSVVEENAIYYAAGYIIHKLLKKFMKLSNDTANIFVGVLLHMVGEDIGGDIPDNTDSYLDYVKVWTRTTDRGGLRHASSDTYRFFLALEILLYQLIEKGELREKVVSEILTNDTDLFLWGIATDLADEKQSLELLQEVAQLWFTIREFSITSQSLEQYKKATKSTIKGKKGLRKELH